MVSPVLSIECCAGWTSRVLRTPEPETNYTHRIWGWEDHFGAFGIKHRQFWLARGPVQYPKNFKRESLPGNVLPDFRDTARMEPVQTEGAHCPSPSCTTTRLATGGDHPPPLRLGVSSCRDKGGPDCKSTFTDTEQQSLPIPSRLTPWRSLLFLANNRPSNNHPFWHFSTFRMGRSHLPVKAIPGVTLCPP